MTSLSSVVMFCIYDHYSTNDKMIFDIVYFSIFVKKFLSMPVLQVLLHIICLILILKSSTGKFCLLSFEYMRFGGLSPTSISTILDANKFRSDNFNYNGVHTKV